MSPRIGITSTRPYAPGGSVHADVAPYVTAVERFGGRAVLLENDAGAVRQALARVDAVVLSGGVDVAASEYGGRVPHQLQQPPSPERDAFEMGLVRATRERAVPTLCICRGLQLANVAFGGTLIEDLREELGEAYTLNHRQTYENGQERAEHAPGHEVELEPGSALARLLGETRVLTNSMHHQALRDAAPDFRIVGRTPDGVVEAVEPTFEHPFFVVVQWHPEELLDDDASARLFGGLIAAATHASLRRSA